MLHIETVRFVDGVSLLTYQLLDAFEFGDTIVKRTGVPDFIHVISTQSFYPPVVIYALSSMPKY